MPPKPKFTKEQIAETAFAIVKEEGVAALTARELGKRLGSSASPIFTIFSNMEEVKMAARELALHEFEQYASDFKEYSPAFKRIGMLMVSYAIHEPEIYKLLFMQEHSEGHSIDDTIGELGVLADECVVLIQRDYAMTDEEAKILFEQMWVHTFGIGALCAMRVCDFNEAEVAEKLGQVFAGMVMVIKSGGLKNIIGIPQKGKGGPIYGKQMGAVPPVQK